MLLLNTQLHRTPVMSLQSGTELGKISTEIIDPRKLQIAAYYVTGARIDAPSILHTADIRELGPLGFIVDNADTVMLLSEDLVRLQEIIDFNFSLIGKNVVDDTKKRLGKVTEYTVEVEDFMIQKIHVAQSMLKNVTSSNLIIHRSQIIEVTDTLIVVRSATLPKQVGLMEAVNPFRKSAKLAQEPGRL